MLSIPVNPNKIKNITNINKNLDFASVDLNKYFRHSIFVCRLYIQIKNVILHFSIITEYQYITTQNTK